MIRRCFGAVKDLIVEKAQVLKPAHLEVIDESWMHESNKESHFRILIVSQEFNSLSSARRNYMVYKALEPSLNLEAMHLVITPKTPSEYSSYKSNTFVFEYPSH
jgi:BolA protein